MLPECFSSYLKAYDYHLPKTTNFKCASGTAQMVEFSTRTPLGGARTA